MMEARSLSSLNFLAANPPQYPVRPNEDKLEALTLYILRVPGTRDVFLSTFKPQVKSVTAEDIASSLYYVHLRDPADDCQPLQTEDGSRERSPSQPNIARKPLPSTARPITPESPPALPRAHPASTPHQWEAPSIGHGPASVHQQKASPLGQTVTPAEPSNPSDLARVPARKPLGPRPLASNPVVVQDIESHASVQLGYPARVPPRPRTQGADMYDRASAEYLTHRRATASSFSANPGSFNLDLIRRDRSSGGQWNVARISCHAEQTSGLAGASETRRSPSPSKQGPQAPIDVSIENSGYAKFRNIPLPSVVEAGPAAIMEALAERASGRSSDHSSNLSLPLTGDATAPSGETANGTYFSRQVTMGYTKSWTASVKEKLQKLEGEARARTGHRRGDSATSGESFDQASAPNESATQGMRPRGYTFASPWNGRCEFRTGNGGRTLRCTHALDSGAANGSSSSEPAVVSELRFNLPTSEVIPGASHPRDSQLLGTFGKALRSRARSDPYGYDDDEDETRPPRFDLSLGKERAGGGRRGNRAKMGKLIITNEGLKMLDLVVAANIGVWWETWENNF